MGVEKVLIAKDLIDCENWFKFDSAVPSLGSEEVKEFLNTYIQGLHLIFSMCELTEDSNDFLRANYKGYSESKTGYGMDYDLLWLDTFGKEIVANLHKIPTESLNAVTGATKYLELTYRVESDPGVLMIHLEKELRSLNKKLATPVDLSLFR